MLTQSETIKIKEIIESKLELTQKGILQLEKAYSSNAMLSIPGNQKENDALELRHKKVMLTLLKQALLRVTHEWFGTCNKCNNPISFSRLMEAPEITKCPDCLN